MKRNCQLYQWYQNNPFAPSRRVFEHGSVEPDVEDPDITEVEAVVIVPVDEDHEEIADTVRVPTLKEVDDKLPLTLPSAKIEKKIPKGIKEDKIQTATDVRSDISENIEETENSAETIAKLERENKQLRALVKVDVLLTDTLNRRAIEEKLVDNIATIDGARDKGLREDEVEDLSILYLDIDYFTQINTALGHPGGDAALKEFVKIIKANLRSVDFLGRHGGEEFMVILPEVDEKGAEIVAEKLRVAVKNGLKNKLIALYPNKKTEIGSLAGTVSVGVTSYNTDSPKQSKTELISQVDQATYKAKHSGRDQVQVHSQKTEGEEGIEEVTDNKGYEIVIDTAIEDKKFDKYASEMKKMAEEIMPKNPEMQEKALREAADRIRKSLV